MITCTPLAHTRGELSLESFLMHDSDSMAERYNGGSGGILQVLELGWLFFSDLAFPAVLVDYFFKKWIHLTKCSHVGC